MSSLCLHEYSLYNGMNKLCKSDLLTNKSCNINILDQHLIYTLNYLLVISQQAQLVDNWWKTRDGRVMVDPFICIVEMMNSHWDCLCDGTGN